MTGTDLKAARNARQKLSQVKGTPVPASDLFGELAKAEAAAGNGGPASPKFRGSFVAIQPCPICLEALVRSKSGDFLGCGYDPRPRTKEDSVSHVGDGVPGAGEAPAAAEWPPPVVR